VKGGKMSEEIQTTEEKTAEEKPAEQPADNTGAGNFTPTSTLLDRADMLVQKLEKANEESARILKRQEEIAARMIISGRAVGGTPQKTTEEKAQEDIDKQVKALVDRFR